MTDRERTDLLIAYAAGALEGSEREAVRARLAAGDPRWVAALAEADEILARLSATVDPVAPSKGHKDRLLASLPDRAGSAVEARQAGNRPGVATSAGRSTPVPQPMRFDATPVPFESRPVRFASRLALAAAVAAVLVGGGVLYVMLQEQKSQVARLDAALADRNARLSDLQNMLGSAEARLSILKPTDAGTQEFGRVWVDPARRQVKVYIFSLVPPPPGKTYQLWLMPEGGGNPVPAPVFTVDSSGRAVLTADIPAGMKTVAGAAVSVEPPKGSTTPSNVKLLSKSL